MQNSRGTQLVAPEGVIYPPNRPMEPRTHFSETPVVYDNFMFLDFNDEGNCILGSSSVSGTFWEGTLMYFKDHKHMEDFDYHGHYISSTTSDGKFLSKNIIALAEDTGHVNVLSLDEDSTIRSTNYFKLIERISRIEVWNDSRSILCCSGRAVSIWEADSRERESLEVFRDFHTDNVTCIDTLKQNPNMFLSGARDRTACIWDLRIPIPPSVLYTNEFSSLTSISWNQIDDNYVIVGTEAGDVYLVDKREPKDFVSNYHCFNAPINRIGFKGSTEFAVCGDTSEVLIVNCEGGSLEMVYKDKKHTGHVKGLKWYQGNLYTCGFGKCVVEHVWNENQ